MPLLSGKIEFAYLLKKIRAANSASSLKTSIKCIFSNAFKLLWLVVCCLVVKHKCSKECDVNKKYYYYNMAKILIDLWSFTDIKTTLQGNRWRCKSLNPWSHTEQHARKKGATSSVGLISTTSTFQSRISNTNAHKSSIITWKTHSYCGDTALDMLANISLCQQVVQKIINCVTFSNYYLWFKQKAHFISTVSSL